MDRPCSIRELKISDIELIKNLFIDVFTHEPWNDDWSDQDQLRHYLEDIIDNKNSLSIGFFSGGELVGISLGSIIHWFSGTEYYIREYCIRRTHQHQGAGTLFLHLIEDYLRSNAIASILLSTDVGTPAHDFYVKNDFREVSRARFFHKDIHVE